MKRCVYCREKFEPSLSAVCVVEGVRRVTQKACEREACRTARKTEAERRSQKADPAWPEKQRGRLAAWRGRNRGYWRRWRQRNPGYRRRERQRQRRRRLERVAKINGLRADPVGEVRRIRKVGRKGVAKINGLERRLDETLGFLEAKERVAKTDGLASAAWSG